MAQGGGVMAGARVREGAEGGGNEGERENQHLLQLLPEGKQQERTIQAAAAAALAVWIASQALHGLHWHLQTDSGLLVRTSTLPGARVGLGEDAAPAPIAATIMNMTTGQRCHRQPHRQLDLDMLDMVEGKPIDGMSISAPTLTPKIPRTRRSQGQTLATREGAAVTTAMAVK